MRRTPVGRRLWRHAGDLSPLPVSAFRPHILLGDVVEDLIDLGLLLVEDDLLLQPLFVASERDHFLRLLRTIFAAIKPDRVGERVVRIGFTRLPVGYVLESVL